jgi:phage repressor protein C with HTH and peptisase S24 domain
MVGDSMTPRFRPGQLLHVNPYKPASDGAGVVVTKTDNVVLIKEFVRRSDTVLYLKQYYPTAELKYPLNEIRDIHIVVGSTSPERTVLTGAHAPQYPKTVHLRQLGRMR